MPSAIDPEPDQPAGTHYVGPDIAGHRRVSDKTRHPEGRFDAFATATRPARAEQDLRHAVAEIAAVPLPSIVSFVPAAGHETALPYAA